MAKQTINIGSAANDGTGSTLRAAFDITNDNFTELYDGTGGLFHKIEGTNFTGSLLIGHSTTGTLSAAIKNTGVGLLALDALTSGDSNTAIGYNAGSSINSGGDNVLIGSQAGDALTSGSGNVAIGKNALSAEDANGTNTAVGYETLKNLNAGANAHNTAIGYDAGTSLTTGIRNTLIGSRAGDSLTEGPRNVAIGYSALKNEDTGRKNTAVGHEALKDLNYDGDGNNVAVGNVAGTAVTTGVKNTILGSLAGDALTEGSNNIIIGYDAAASAVDVSNEVTIGDSNIANVRIPSDSTLKIGVSGDLQLEHLSSNSFIKNTAVGDLYIENQVDDKDIIFRSDDGSGGLATYFYLDGSASQVKFEVDVKLHDNDIFRVGSSDDLKIFHSGTESFIQADGTGNLTIEQKTDDADIVFKSDDGSGEVTAYFTLDGSEVENLFNKKARFPDNVKLTFGGSRDLEIYHDSTNSVINNKTGHLQIYNNADDGDIVFISDDGSGGTTEYFKVDGGAEQVIFSKEIKTLDNVNIKIGGGGDLRLYHNGTNSNIENFTGTLQIIQNLDDGDISFKSDNGSGGTTEYFRVDGDASTVAFSQTITQADNKYIGLGNSFDFHLQHNGTNSVITNSTGNLEIRQDADDADIIFYSDDGSGSTTEYFRFDGSSVQSIISKPFRFLDSVQAIFGTGNDLKIQHNGTDNFIDSYNGHLNIRNHNADKDIIFQADDGSGGLATYFQLDGSDGFSKAHKKIRFLDNAKASFGNVDDLEIFHGGTNTAITNKTGNLVIKNETDDGDIIFESDDGSGGIAEYFRVDGGSEKVIFSKTLNAVNSSANGKAATFDDGTSALHIVPNLGSGGYTGLSAVGDIGLIFTIDNDNTTDSTSNGLLIAPHTQTSGGLKILENGNVGIGISSPGSKLDVSGGDIETSTASKGLILKSPNGTRYRVTVDNSGNLSTAAL
jgi:hypothetical protein